MFAHHVPCVLSVMVGLWPSCEPRSTIDTLPSCRSRLAKQCRKSYGRFLSSPAALAAGSKWRWRQFRKCGRATDPDWTHEQEVILRRPPAGEPPLGQVLLQRREQIDGPRRSARFSAPCACRPPPPARSTTSGRARGAIAARALPLVAGRRKRVARAASRRRIVHERASHPESASPADGASGVTARLPGARLPRGPYRVRRVRCHSNARARMPCRADDALLPVGAVAHSGSARRELVLGDRVLEVVRERVRAPRPDIGEHRVVEALLELRAHRLAVGD
jgi:hypothetical protein